jgi:hypothetical protein
MGVTKRRSREEKREHRRVGEDEENNEGIRKVKEKNKEETKRV